MNSDSLAALATAAGGVLTAIATVTIRLSNQASKSLRRNRKTVELLKECLYETRLVAIDHGAKRAELPKMPPEVLDDFNDDDE